MRGGARPSAAAPKKGGCCLIKPLEKGDANKNRPRASPPALRAEGEAWKSGMGLNQGSSAPAIKMRGESRMKGDDED